MTLPDVLPRIGLIEIVLKSGGHASREQAVCAMEAVAWLAGERERPVTLYFFALYGGTVLVLLLACLILDRGIDLAVQYWNQVRSQAIVIRWAWPIERRQSLRRAMGGRS